MSTQPGLRLEPRAVQAWLDRLDRSASLPSGPEQRLSPRFAYRQAALTLGLGSGDEVPVRQEIACRNLSRHGAGLLAGKFIYPRTPCRLTLVSPHGRQEVVEGRVVRCRYLLGSGSLYEVGVEFDQVIDLELFAPHARLVRILLVAPALATHELVSGLLRTLRAELRCVATEAEALRALENADFGLVLIDLDSTSFDPFGLVRQLRERGYVGPVVGMALPGGAELYSRCLVAGCTGYIPKPPTQEDLHNLVASLRDAPLISSLARDSALAPLIDRYVADLRSKVAQMASAAERGDLESLNTLVCHLRATAGSYGFGPITEEATYVHALIAVRRPLAEIRRALRQLMHVCLLARPASVS